MDTSYDQVDEAQQHKFLRDCAYLIFVGNAKTINCVFHTYVIVLWALNGYKNQDHDNPNHSWLYVQMSGLDQQGWDILAACSTPA